MASSGTGKHTYIQEDRSDKQVGILVKRGREKLS